MIVEILTPILNGLVNTFGNIYVAVAILALAGFVITVIATRAPLLYVAAFLAIPFGAGVIYQIIEVKAIGMFAIVMVLGLMLFFSIYRVFLR